MVKNLNWSNYMLFPTPPPAFIYLIDYGRNNYSSTTCCDSVEFRGCCGFWTYYIFFTSMIFLHTIHTAVLKCHVQPIWTWTTKQILVIKSSIKPLSVSGTDIMGLLLRQQLSCRKQYVQLCYVISEIICFPFFQMNCRPPGLSPNPLPQGLLWRWAEQKYSNVKL